MRKINSLQVHAHAEGYNRWTTYYLNGLITAEEYVTGIQSWSLTRFRIVWGMRVQAIRTFGESYWYEIGLFGLMLAVVTISAILGIDLGR